MMTSKAKSRIWLLDYTQVTSNLTKEEVEALIVKGSKIPAQDVFDNQQMIYPDRVSSVEPFKASDHRD